MQQPDPTNAVIKVFLGYCHIHPAELPMPDKEEETPKPQRPHVADQFHNPAPTKGQRILAFYFRI